MREPAKSCFSCRRALQPGEVLYTESAEMVCESCGPARPRGGRTWREAMERRRRTNHRRWMVSGIVFGWMVAGLFVTWRVHARLTVATIDVPAPLATVTATTLVRGHVLAQGLPQPLWLVAQTPERCPSDPFFATRVVARSDGSWESPSRLAGPPGQRFLLTVVAADELADAALERTAERESAAGEGPAPGAGNGGPCRPLPGGWLDLPSGSVALASRAVTLGDAPGARASARWSP